MPYVLLQQENIKTPLKKYTSKLWRINIHSFFDCNLTDKFWTVKTIQAAPIIHQHFLMLLFGIPGHIYFHSTMHHQQQTFLILHPSQKRLKKKRQQMSISLFNDPVISHFPINLSPHQIYVTITAVLSENTFKCPYDIIITGLFIITSEDALDPKDTPLEL